MPHHQTRKHKSLRKSHRKPTMSNKGYSIAKRIRHKGKPAPMHNINYAIRASLVPENEMKENNSFVESVAMNQNLRRSSRAASTAASQKIHKQSASKKNKSKSKSKSRKYKSVRFNYYPNISSNQPRASIYYHMPASSSSAAASNSASNLNKMFASMTL